MTRHLIVRGIHGVPAVAAALLVSLVSYGFMLGVSVALYESSVRGILGVTFNFTLDGLRYTPIILLTFAACFVALRLIRLLNPICLAACGFVSGSVLVVYGDLPINSLSQTVIAETVVGGIAGLVGFLAAFSVLRNFARKDTMSANKSLNDDAANRHAR